MTHKKAQKTHADHLELFLKSRGGAGGSTEPASPRTIVFYESNLRAFVAHLDEQGIEQPKKIDLLEWMAGDGGERHGNRHNGRPEAIAASTMHARQRAIRAYFRWGADLELWPEFKSSWKIHQDKHEPKYLTKDEEARVLEAAGVGRRHYRRSAKRTAALVCLAVDSGLRRAELAELRWGDLDVERLTVRVRLGKGSKNRTTYMRERTVELLDALYRHDPHNLPAPADPVFLSEGAAGEKGRKAKALTPGGVGQIINTVSDRSGVDFTCHQLRHTFGITAAKELPIGEVQVLMGHSSLVPTQIYTTPRQDDAIAHAIKVFAKRR